jgi:hypothetical protein
MQDEYARTPLHVAAANKSLRTVDHIVSTSPAVARAVDIFGHTPLDDAITANHASCVAVLKEAGAPCGTDKELQGEHVAAVEHVELVSAELKVNWRDRIVDSLPEYKIANEIICVTAAVASFVEVSFSLLFCLVLLCSAVWPALHASHSCPSHSFLPQVSYGNVQVFLSALRTQLTCETATSSTSNESRLAGSVHAIETSLTELHDVLCMPMQTYHVLKSFLVVVMGGDVLKDHIASIRPLFAEVRCMATGTLSLLSAFG